MPQYTAVGVVRDDGKAITTDEGVPGRALKFRYVLDPSRRRKAIRGELTDEAQAGDPPNEGDLVVLVVQSRQIARMGTVYETVYWGTH